MRYVLETILEKKKKKRNQPWYWWETGDEDEKLQYDPNIEVVKISALSSGKIRKYEHPTGEEILPSFGNQK